MYINNSGPISPAQFFCFRRSAAVDRTNRYDARYLMVRGGWIHTRFVLVNGQQAHNWFDPTLIGFVRIKSTAIHKPDIGFKREIMNVIFLAPGPLYDVSSSAFKLKYRCLSKNLSGYVISTSDCPVELTIDNFNLLACKYEENSFSIVKYTFFCLKKAIEIKRQGIHVDLVITYDPIKTGGIGCLLKLILKTKLIVEVNGVYTSPAVWEGAAGTLLVELKKKIVPTIITFVLKRADGIKLLFKGQIDDFEINCKRKTVATFFNWVNTDQFKNLGDSKEILFVGFPYRIKGVDVLIRAFKLVAHKHQGWKLKILGWYPDRRALDAEINGHSQIFYHPSVPASEMPDHMGKCGFFVLSSRTEAMGRVLLEAMAAGKARIGTRVDGIPAVLDDGVDGFLVEPDNEHALSKKMDLLMNDCSLRRRLGIASAMRAKKEFSADCYLNYTMQFYNQVISKDRRQ